MNSTRKCWSYSCAEKVALLVCMQGVLAKMMDRDPAKRIDAAALWQSMQEDITNHGTMNPAEGTILANPTVVLGATVLGVHSPSAPTLAEESSDHKRNQSASDVRHEIYPNLTSFTMQTHNKGTVGHITRIVRSSTIFSLSRILADGVLDSQAPIFSWFNRRSRRPYSAHRRVT